MLSYYFFAREEGKMKLEEEGSEKQVEDHISNETLYILYINEFEEILDLNVNDRYKVILVSERIKDLRIDTRFK